MAKILRSKRRVKLISTVETLIHIAILAKNKDVIFTVEPCQDGFVVTTKIKTRYPTFWSIDRDLERTLCNTINSIV